MQPRTTAILFLVALVLVGFVYLYEIQGQSARDEATSLEKRLFPGLESDAVTAIALPTSDGRTARAERGEKGWRLLEPLEFPGDTFALDGIASALAEVEREAVYEEPQPAEVYGLGEPAQAVRFETADGEKALRLGNDAPLGGQTYASVEGRDPVVTIPTWRAQALRKSLDELRDKRVLSFDAASVAAVEARWPGGRVALARGDEGWRIEAPVTGRADEQAVDRLLSDLSFLRASGFVDEPGSDAETGLDEPAFAVTLELESVAEGEPGRSLALALGSAVTDGERLARAEHPSLYRVPEARLTDFPREVDAYRDKRLADFAPEDARRLVLRFAEAEAPVELVREDGRWRAKSEDLDAEKLAALVGSLSRLEAEEIVAESVGPDEEKALELSPPNVEVRVYGDDEDAPLARVNLGAERGEDGRIAQSPGEPLVFQLAPAVAEGLPRSLEALRRDFAPPPPPEPAEQGAETDAAAEPTAELPPEGPLSREP